MTTAVIIAPTIKGKTLLSPRVEESAATTKKIQTITQSILPMATDYAAVFDLQNLMIRSAYPSFA